MNETRKISIDLKVQLYPEIHIRGHSTTQNNNK